MSKTVGGGSNSLQEVPEMTVAGTGVGIGTDGERGNKREKDDLRTFKLMLL